MKEYETSDKSLSNFKVISPLSKILGKRYVKRLHKNVANVYDNSKLIDADGFVYSSVNKLSKGMGWYTYHPDKTSVERMFHIDIHSAYTNLYTKYTGKIINKREFGKIKCVDPYLYQRIRKEIEVRSREILSSFDNVLLYWRTDGGIVITKDDSFVEQLRFNNPDLVIDEIIDSKEMYIHPSIKIPESLKNTAVYKTRVFAYQVIHPSSIEIVYANNFEAHKNKILKENNMLGLEKYNANMLAMILTNRKE